MTRTEAKIVAEIMCEADNRCADCSLELLNIFAQNFPQWKELIKSVFLNSFENVTWND